MRKFKFVGDSTGWKWKKNPIKNFIYDDWQLGEMAFDHTPQTFYTLQELISDMLEQGTLIEIFDVKLINEKLIKLDSLFGQVLILTGEIWDIASKETLEGGVDQKMIELIVSISEKYDRLRTNFDK